MAWKGCCDKGELAMACSLSPDVPALLTRPAA